MKQFECYEKHTYRECDYMENVKYTPSVLHIFLLPFRVLSNLIVDVKIEFAI